MRLLRRSCRALLEERAVPGDDISGLDDEQATAVALEVASSPSSALGADWVVHGDVHHHNILRHGARFVAIDPKPYLGCGGTLGALTAKSRRRVVSLACEAKEPRASCDGAGEASTGIHNRFSRRRNGKKECGMTIELTPAQASAVAELAAREGAVSLHQLPHTDPRARADDVYATPVGAPRGYRVAADGQISEIGETLSARI